MANLYVFASIPDQGKTTTALLLEKKLRKDGKRVACLQMNKGVRDVHRYLFEGCYHYSVPLEATQSINTFEQWVPEGYDAYIMEITIPYSPFGAVYVDLFNRINEVISYDARDNWKQNVYSYYQDLWSKIRSGLGPKQDLMELWDFVRNRQIRTVITKTPKILEGPCVGRDLELHNMDALAVENFQPKMTLPKSSKDVIAVGSFPAEFWDMFPSLRWYRFDYSDFMNELKLKIHDLAIIGSCGSNNLRLPELKKEQPVICYQPSVLQDMKKAERVKPFSGDYPSLVSRIKNQKPGTPLVPEGEPHAGYNNRYWVNQEHSGVEPVWKSGNSVFCDGWVLPKYLIRDGYLEVN
jgi:hypothetical protein